MTKKQKPGSQSPTARALRKTARDKKVPVINFITPQFERGPHQRPPDAPPKTKEDWNWLRKMTKAELKARGLSSWDGRLMLIPGEWYSSIPKGFELEGIGGKTFTFEPGETDNDIRFGCLAYGVPAVDGKRTVED